MGTRKNKTRLGEWEYTIQKPMANDVVMRNGLFVALLDGYIIPADGTTQIEGIAINDRYSGENNEHRYCIYQPKRDWEHFTMEVDNGTIKQEDVGKTFWITGGLQHINYSTKAEKGGQFRLEEVLNDTLGTFTYNKDVQFAPQGPQGNDGQTPELEMGTVTKLPSDAQPTAQLVQDAQDPTKYTLNLGIPAGSRGEKGAKGDTGEKGDKGNTGAAGTDGVNGTNGTDGADGDYPHREGDWNGGTTYTHLAMVRYPDTNNEYWTWIWKSTEPTSGSTPGVDNRRGKMNKDGDEGPKGEDGGTVVVPVEGKPGKDGIGVDGRDGTDGKSPHNEGIWNSTRVYSALALVRAKTGNTNVFGDDIRGWYITQNGANPGYAPQDGSPRALVVEDGNGLASAKEYIDDFRRKCLLLVKARGQTVTKKFQNGGVQQPETVSFSNRFGTPTYINRDSQHIIIKETGLYRIFAHTILQCNPSSNTPYINMGRMSIYKNGNIPLGTSKMGGPFISTQVTSGLWLDLNVDITMTLYEGDVLSMLVRCQSDADNVDGNSGTYVIIGADDETGGSSSGTLGGSFATYMGVQMITENLDGISNGAI